jgi:hypothetical protein
MFAVKIGISHWHITQLNIILLDYLHWLIKEISKMRIGILIIKIHITRINTICTIGDNQKAKYQKIF